jgi:hypothetical protein
MDPNHRPLEIPDSWLLRTIILYIADLDWRPWSPGHYGDPRFSALGPANPAQLDVGHLLAARDGSVSEGRKYPYPVHNEETLDFVVPLRYRLIDGHIKSIEVMRMLSFQTTYNIGGAASYRNTLRT